MKRLLISIAIIVSSIVIIFLLVIACENQVSPFWLKLDTILICNDITDGYDSVILNESLKKLDLYKINTIEEKLDSVLKIYNRFHRVDNSIEDLENFIGRLPLWNIKKINLIFDTLAPTKKFVINGVTGTGKSTFVDLTAKLLTGDPERIIKLQCVENMEIEYHKRWIGYYEKEKFIPGKLLKLIEKAESNPQNNYVFILDDFDKIPPATFFGSELWMELNNEIDKTFIDGYNKEIYFPDNLFLISVTHISADSKVNFSDEEKRRLGYFYDLKPNYEEFLLYIKERNIKDRLGLTSAHIKKLLFTFVKINELISSNVNYGPGFVLGQWSTLRKNIKPEELDHFIDIFIQHVNSFNPDRKFLHSDVEDVIEAEENSGKLPNTNFLYRVYKGLLDTGVFAELTVALLFTIFSIAFGWFVFIRKRLIINKIQSKLFKCSKDYTSGRADYEETLREMFKLKSEIYVLVGKRQIKHEEGVFLLLYIEDEVDKIEKFHEVNELTKDLQQKFKEFMSDGVIDKKEYELLHKFLESMKTSIAPDVYYRLMNEIDALYEKRINT